MDHQSCYFISIAFLIEYYSDLISIIYQYHFLWRFIMILYFSATGNCKYTAERIASAINDKAISIESFSSDNLLLHDEILGIVTPVYFYELPIIVHEFLKNIKISGKPIYSFIVTTYSTSPGCTFIQAKKLLNKKDFVSFRKPSMNHSCRFPMPMFRS